MPRRPLPDKFPIPVERKKCRECGKPNLQIIGATDDTLEVECTDCGESYDVETDGLGDGGIHYWPIARTIQRTQERREDEQMEAEDQVKEGDRIVLDEMQNDPDPIAVGTQGTVKFVNRLSGGINSLIQVEVAWDNGRSLMLSCPPDKFRILKGQKQ